MDDLISRKAAIDAVNTWDWQELYLPIHFKQLLEELPSAQPEQKTGHWIQNDNGTWSCDQCHSWIPDEQHYYARYCLYCGAKMG